MAAIALRRNHMRVTVALINKHRSQNQNKQSAGRMWATKPSKQFVLLSEAGGTNMNGKNAIAIRNLDNSFRRILTDSR